MQIASHMKKGGKYIMTYEYGGGPVDGVMLVKYTFSLLYKISDDPLVIVTGDEERIVPVSSLCIVYDEEEVMGVVSCGRLGDVLVNKDGADKGSWQSRKTGERTKYPRNPKIAENDCGSERVVIWQEQEEHCHLVTVTNLRSRWLLWKGGEGPC